MSIITATTAAPLSREAVRRRYDALAEVLRKEVGSCDVWLDADEASFKSRRDNWLVTVYTTQVVYVEPPREPWDARIKLSAMRGGMQFTEDCIAALAAHDEQLEMVHAAHHAREAFDAEAAE